MAATPEILMFGLQKTTLIDYPGEVAASIFMPRCNMRCPYCHNPDLIELNDDSSFITMEEFSLFLDKRQKVLGGICITGGEPLLTPGILRIVERIKEAGLKVKIDTNGTYPERLKELLALGVDFVAMDIKTLPEKYHLLGYRGDAGKVLKKSLEIILTYGVNHEFRTTVVPGIVELEDAMGLARLAAGGQNYSLAQYRNELTLDRKFLDVLPYPQEILKKMCRLISEAGIPCRIRGRY